MAAGLGTLSDHRIGARGLQVERLGHRRGTREDGHAGVAAGGERPGLGQAEVEADHRRGQFEQRLESSLVEADLRRGGLGRLAQSELVVERCDLGPGRAGGIRIHGGRLMTEEVELEGPVGGRAHGRRLAAELVDREHRRAEPSESAGRTHSGGELGRGHAGHGRLEDRMLDAEQLGDGGVHGS